MQLTQHNIPCSAGIYKKGIFFSSILVFTFFIHPTFVHTAFAHNDYIVFCEQITPADEYLDELQKNNRYSIGWEKQELLATPKEALRYQARDNAKEISDARYSQHKHYAFDMTMPLWQYFSLQTGYQVNAAQKTPTVKSANGNLNNESDGQLNDPANENGLGSEKYKGTSLQKKEWHADVIGFIPFPNELPFQLIGSVGLSSLKLIHESNIAKDIPEDFPINAAQYQYHRYETGVLRLGGGFQYHPLPDIGFRTSLTWANTSKVRELLPMNNGFAQEEDFKDLFQPSVGVFMRF